jgi:hypothetical protein
MAAWAVAAPQDRPVLIFVLGTASLAAAIGLSASLSAVVPLTLRWDGQGWTLGPAASAGNEPWPGEVTVCIDLGNWLLLRFRHRSSGCWPKVTWLPVQRRGQQAQWHALRCALYSTRPTPVRGAADNDA